MNLRPTIATILSTFLITAFITFPDSRVSSQSRRLAPTQKPNTFSGGKAVEELKRAGSYESLIKAFEKSSESFNDKPDAPNLLANGSYDEVGLTAPDGQTWNEFGGSVAVFGNTAVVGSYGDTGYTGSVYVFLRSGNDWTQQAKLTASDGAPGDFFGWSVSIHKDTIAVGAVSDTVGSNPYQGSAYIFVRSGNSWSEQEKLSASDGTSMTGFGAGISIRNDTVIVGANTDSVGANQYQGSAYVFVRSGGDWTEQAKLFSSDGQGSDYFGTSVALSEDTVVVGAPSHDAGPALDQGAIYVFTRSGQSWNQSTKLIAADGSSYDRLGQSVSISEKTIVAGAYGDGPIENSSRGSAYIFVESGGVWAQETKLIRSNGVDFDYFGWSVSISGDRVVVGAYGSDTPSFPGQGAAYVFSRSGTTWTEDNILRASDANTNDAFGISVAVSGDTVVSGAPWDEVQGHVYRGSVKIFQTEMAISKSSPPQLLPGSSYGYRIALSGDTAVVGSPYESVDGNSQQGAAYVFKRSGVTWTQQAKLVSDDGAPDDYFGIGVDIEGDNIVVGAYNKNINGNAVQGAAYVFVRNGTTWTQQARLSHSDPGNIDAFGNSVAISGDTVLVGSWLNDTSFSAQGAAYVFIRTGGMWSQQQKLIASDGMLFSMFGWSVDLNGDTAAISANGHDSKGAAYIFTRSGSNWSEGPKLIAPDTITGDQFGESIAISGDSVAVGALMKDSGRGAAYVFTRDGASWGLQQKLTSPDGMPNDHFGLSVSISGDVIAVGAPFDDIGTTTDQGSLHIFSRRGSVWSWERQLTEPLPTPTLRLGVESPSGGLSAGIFGYSVAISPTTLAIGATNADGGRGTSYFDYWGGFRTTSAGASLSGRVLETNGRGLANATVILTDSKGVERTVQTGSFGRFSFSGLPSGETYIVSVRSRRFVFSPQVVNLQSDLSDVRLEASGRSGR